MSTLTRSRLQRSLDSVAILELILVVLYFLIFRYLSVFKTSGIVLKVKKQNEKESLYTVFFRDYGILIVQKKKKVREKALDIGYNINCEIVTKSTQDIHTIGNIQISSQFIYEDREYKSIELYLKLVGYILKEVPRWVPHWEIHTVLQYLSKNSEWLWYEKILLSFLKIQCILGNTKEIDDETIQKILKFVEWNKIERIMQLQWVDEEIIKKLEHLL